ncbi:MAG: 3-dehydroquinate synthase [Candidatus Micrarchaeota archaeon]|nr:3-dehydroquinate synthase [Candidatus Micrarchaeota archaeon]
MRTVHVKLRERSYEIFIGSGALNAIGPWLAKQGFSKKALVVTVPSVKKLFGAKVEESLCSAGFAPRFAVVPEGEGSKSLAKAIALYGECIRFGMDRWSPVIALGGGVVGDLAGFVSATFMRGLPFIQVPTTLLAQVDSSIGGKTGVDLPHGKNLVGCFYQPKAVFSDVSVLKTLPAKEVRNGLAEIIKHGASLDAKLFSFLEHGVGKILSLDEKALEETVAWNARVKAGVVEKDEYEQKGARMLLNFGHTVGHAVEAASKFRLSHGESVAIGMVGELLLSHELAGLDKNDSTRVITLIERAGLPTMIPSTVPLNAVLAAAKLDKKARAGTIRAVLLKRIGSAFVAPVPLNDFKKAVEELAK